MNSNIQYFIILLLALQACSYNQPINKTKNIMGNNNIKEIRFVAIGDSYTIGQGLEEKDSWPNLLASHLNASGIKINLVANPSRTGWTAKQEIDFEIPILKKSNADFTTLLIGVNDFVQGVDEETFRERLSLLIDKIQESISNKDNLLIITIPDFSATPAGKNFGNEKDISKGLMKFNSIIKEEAKKRNLNVVDIYTITQEMGNDKSLIENDGLHPTKKEYEIWESVIYPVALKMLKK